MYTSAPTFKMTETAKTQNEVFAMSSTPSQMRKMTLIQKAHGRTPSSGGGVVRERQLYQTIFATSDMPSAMTAGQ